MLGTRALVGTPSGVPNFDFSDNFDNFCVQEFIADTKLHELALQRGKLGKYCTKLKLTRNTTVRVSQNLAKLGGKPIREGGSNIGS